ncbi:MAG: thymidine phosphorylase [Candidatus Lernaella stagnicola]|nr:thymidine phosphorylase [Candidatus Lernaella stagnicola]
MQAVDILRKKRDGLALRSEEIKWFVETNLTGEVTDYQLTAMLMAIFLQGMSEREVAALTRAFMESGRIVDLSHIVGPKVDKHSTGGVGDKVSLILAPMAACMGLKVPMVSGRGLGHTGGTLDKLESIPGYDPFLSMDRFEQLVDEIGCAIIGQTDDMCPADRKWYAMRDVTGTVESIDLITASIMSKKLAEGIDALVLDVKVGSGAFMQTMDDAVVLAESMVRLGREMDRPVRAVITDMNQPLGRQIGNANEVVESVEILRGQGDARLTDLCCILCAHMMAAGGVADDLDAATTAARETLTNGRALDTFKKMVAAQGGDVAYVEHPERLPQAPRQTVFTAPNEGVISAIDTAELGRAAGDLGAGRRRAEDEIDFGAGITIHKTLGDEVAAGEVICELHAGDQARLAAGLARLESVFSIGAEPVSPAPLVQQVVLSE